MSKSLRKAVALVSAAVLFLAGAFPDAGLTLVIQLFRAATEHPFRAVLVLLGIALAAYAFWDSILDVLGIQSRKRLESNIRAWLDSFSFAVKREIDPLTYFNFSVTPENIPTFTVALSRQLDRYVVIGTRVGLTNEDRVVVDNLPLGDQEAFKANLGIVLTRGKTTFRLDLPNNELMITNRIPVTADLTEHLFMTAVDELVIARAAAINALILLIGTARANLAAQAATVAAPQTVTESLEKVQAEGVEARVKN